jgi:hypothetical protein
LKADTLLNIVQGYIMITKEYLQSVINYDSQTGIFTWKIKKGRKLIGSKAGKDCHGYSSICIDYKSYFAHRLAWLYVYGYMPKLIDHINLNKSDNRIINLREATVSQNSCNSKIRVDNVSGIKGVSWDKLYNKWYAKCTFNKTQYNLGKYNNIEDAINVVNAFRHQHHQEFARAI